MQFANEKSIALFFTQDHERLDELFKQYQLNKNTDFKLAKNAFVNFYQGLVQHIHWEEEVLFPFFEKETGLTQGGPTHVMRQEHIEIKDWLEQIKAKVHHGNTQTENEERKLLIVLGNHNAKEEEILYPMIEQSSNLEQRNTLFDKLKHTLLEAQCCCC